MFNNVNREWVCSKKHDNFEEFNVQCGGSAEIARELGDEVREVNMGQFRQVKKEGQRCFKQELVKFIEFYFESITLADVQRIEERMPKWKQKEKLKYYCSSS